MTDRDDGASYYEGAVEDFVSKQNGGELTPQVLYGFLKAKNDDDKARHESVMHKLDRHFAEAAVRDQRLLDHDAAIRLLKGRFDAQRIVGIVAAICVILIAVACLEFIDREKFAGVMSLVLTIAVVFGGWYISSRKR